VCCKRLQIPRPTCRMVFRTNSVNQCEQSMICVKTHMSRTTESVVYVLALDKAYCRRPRSKLCYEPINMFELPIRRVTQFGCSSPTRYGGADTCRRICMRSDISIEFVGIQHVWVTFQLNLLGLNMYVVSTCSWLSGRHLESSCFGPVNFGGWTKVLETICK